MDHLIDKNQGSFIVVEANIGAGKTSLTAALAAYRQARSNRPCHLLAEPVDKPAFRRLLGAYYGDPKRWGFTFQMYALKERFRQHTYAAEMVSSGNDVVQDRSIYADGIFGELVHADGNMTDDEWAIYKESFNMLKRFLRYPDVMVYLRVSPETCLKRLKRRNRSEEVGVSLDYLKRLHDGHERLVETMSQFTRVAVLDWEEFQAVEVVNEAVEKAMKIDTRHMLDFCKL